MTFGHGDAVSSAASCGRNTPVHHPRVARIRAGFVAGLLLFTAARLLWLWHLPLDLSGDEAYYWEWGRHLSFGYFSKPPGIAWLMALASWAGGDTAFGLRAFAALLGAGTLWFVFRLTEELYDTAAGVWAALALAMTPAGAVAATVLTPDAPLMFFWTGALYCFWRFVADGGRSRAWGAGLAGCCAAGMLCKQMMMVFPVLGLLFLGCAPRCRFLLRRPALWGWFALSFLPLLPTFCWNLRHQWLTWHATMHHFSPGNAGFAACGVRLERLAGSQLALATPLLYVILILALVAVLFRGRRAREHERFLLMFSAPGLAAMALATTRQSINANWPLVFYLALVVLTAGWALHSEAGEPSTARRRWFQYGVVSAALITTALYIAVLFPPPPWLQQAGMDPTVRLRGWSQIAGDVASVQRDLPDRKDAIFITVGHRWLTSTLAFYLPGRPQVYVFRHDPRVVEDQHDLWESPDKWIGRDALIVVPGGTNSLPAGLLGCFETIECLKQFEYPQQQIGYRCLSVFRGSRLLSWPTRENRANQRLLRHE
jgi:4-amino-4-deoxy-L-arabinose transferase-like glycosyltransferase